MKITLLGVLVLLGAGALLWYVLQQVKQHTSQLQQVESDELSKPSQDPGPYGNQTAV